MILKLEESKKLIVRNVNTIILQTYWNIGRMVVEEEQKENTRTKYRSALLKGLYKELTKEYGRFFKVKFFLWEDFI